MSAAGRWELVIRTPIGRQNAVLEFVEGSGQLSGVARTDTGDIALSDVVADGNRLTWSQSITRPMKLDLRFDVVIDGDTLTGTSKAGRLPSSKVAGTRVSAGAAGNG